jgi:molybdopterin converting factor small subunit
MGIAEALGSKKFIFPVPDGADILILLQLLSGQFGRGFADQVFEKDEFKKAHTMILLNGRSMWALEGIHCSLADGDDVFIAPIIAGG